jgi:hypothetical protein
MTPDEFLTLAQNAVILSGKVPRKVGKYGMPEMVALVPAQRYDDTFYKGATSKGKTIPVYDIVNANNPQAGFKAYICEYQRSEVSYTVLGKGADFCFTVTMNGCTFGIGVPNQEGDILVSHCNQAEVENITDSLGTTPEGNMYEKQLALVKKLHGDKGAYLEPARYRPNGKENITTFGVRRGGAWEFWYQSYTYDSGPGTFTLIGLFPFVSSAMMI